MSILGLFRKSPFRPIQEHMKKIHECVHLVKPLVEAFIRGNYEEVSKLASEIYQKEHEADEIKNSIRDSLPTSLFLPVDRRDLLDVLASQDAIADVAEDVAVLVSLRKFTPPEDLSDMILELCDRVVAVFEKAFEVVDHLDELVETSFSGKEAEKVINTINELGYLEWKTDKFQMKIATNLYSRDDLKPAELLLLDKIIQKIADISNASERMGNRLRLFLSH